MSRIDWATRGWCAAVWRPISAHSSAVDSSMRVKVAFAMEPPRWTTSLARRARTGTGPRSGLPSPERSTRDPDPLLRPPPEITRPCRIHRVGTHALHRPGVCRGCGDVAILEVETAAAVELRRGGRPHGRCRALRNGLPGRLRVGRPRIAQRREGLLGEVTSELGQDHARVHGERAHALLAVA